MVRGVIFDLGGTLAAPENHLADDALDRLNAGGLLRWLRQRGLQVDGDFVEALVDERRANEVKRARVASEVTAVDALRPVLQRYHLPHDDGFISEAEVAFFQPELLTMRPLPGAPEILTRLRALGLRAGLASNASSDYFVQTCCQRLAFDAFLDPIVSSAAVGWQKPDRRMFDPFLSAWSLPPGQVVMVGDTPAADIVGANRLAMRSILIPGMRPHGPSAAGARPDAVGADLFAVAGTLEQWIAGTP